jgi:transposase-like protein
MTDFVNKVCPECGSSSFSATGSIKWDICLQKWVADSPDDDGNDLWCHECNADFHIEVERPLNLKEIAQVAINKQEATQ